MTGTWDPILLHLPPVLRPCRFARHPLLLPTSPSLSSALTRLDSSLVSLLSSSFPSPVDGPLLRIPTYLPTYDHTFSTSLFPSASLSTHVYLPIYQSTLFSLSKHYFSSATNAKLKCILLYSLCKYAGIAASMARVFPPLLFPTASSSPSPRPSSTFAILFTIICIQHSANGYRGCHAAATGTTGCFTFPLKIASKLYRRCTCAHLAAMTFTRLHVKIC